MPGRLSDQAAGQGPHSSLSWHLQEKRTIFSCRSSGKKLAQSTEGKVLSRIYSKGRGWAFSEADFLDLGPRSAIDSILSRREKAGRIRRVLRGVYDYPRRSKLLDQTVSPDIDQVAHALARKFGWRILPSGATAQNLLGLSTQVPSRASYLSDGPTRSYRLGNTPLGFKHTVLKENVFKLRESQLVVQALKAFGEDRITPAIILQLKAQFEPAIRRKILADAKTATGWVLEAV